MLLLVMLNVYYPCKIVVFQPVLLLILNLLGSHCSFITCYWKKCSDLPLLCMDNKHLFLEVTVLLFLHLVVRQIDEVVFPIKFKLNLIAVLIFALYST